MSNINKLISYVFRFSFLIFIILNYIYFVFYMWYPKPENYYPTLLVLFVFHFLILLLIWSLFMTALTEPGRVPLYWGFYLGDNDEKRRRYCLMCNVFKPERCHHCSICNKCILNMDHHCPWINNCVGFYNRKFFIQMLFYLSTMLIFSDCINFHHFYQVVMKIYRNRVNLNKEITDSLIFLLYYSVDFTVSCVITLFFKFHLTIILENKTTIETIDKKTVIYQSPFDIGSSLNWYQVMGTSKLLWFFPIKVTFGMPLGNGIDWSGIEESKKLNNISLTTDNVAENSAAARPAGNPTHLNTSQNAIPINVTEMANKQVSANENPFVSLK